MLKGKTDDYEDVEAISSKVGTYEDVVASSEDDPGYTELNRNRFKDDNTTEDHTYQKLLKLDSDDYVMPANDEYVNPANDEYVIPANDEYVIPATK